MSMLTPPGMGGKYRVTGNQYPRMRRSRSRGRLVTGAVLAVAALTLGTWGTLQLIDVFGDGDGTKADAAGNPACRPSTSATASATGSLPKPGSITVNVYNATAQGGLAKDTADALEKRGFKIGEVGNAPAEYDKKVKGTALLLGGPAAANGLKVVGTQIATPATRTEKDRKGGAVNLMIGKDFTKLVETKAAEKAMAALATPSPGPSKTC